jgi:hypothetical protein
MKTLISGLLITAALMFGSPARAWNCDNPLASRVAVPAGTQGAFGDGDGQLFLGRAGEGTPGVLYQCQVPNGNPGSNSSSTSSSTSKSTSKSTSTSNSGVNGSGNSNQQQGQGQSQNATGGTAVAEASNGNVTTFNSQSSYQEVKQNPGAIAPTMLVTGDCLGSVSAAGSTSALSLGFGVSRVDKGCDSRRTSILFHELGNDLAAAKIACSTDAAQRAMKKAHLTLSECLRFNAPQRAEVVVAPSPVVPAPPTVVVVHDTIQVTAPTPAPTSSVAISTEQTYPLPGCYMENRVLTNVCKRLLDDVAVRLNGKTDAKLRITGPWYAASAVHYLEHDKHVDAGRIGQPVFSDDQNGHLSMELFWNN